MRIPSSHTYLHPPATKRNARTSHTLQQKFHYRSRSSELEWTFARIRGGLIGLNSSKRLSPICHTAPRMLFVWDLLERCEIVRNKMTKTHPVGMPPYTTPYSPKKTRKRYPPSGFPSRWKTSALNTLARIPHWCSCHTARFGSMRTFFEKIGPSGT